MPSALSLFEIMILTTEAFPISGGWSTCSPFSFIVKSKPLVKGNTNKLGHTLCVLIYGLVQTILHNWAAATSGEWAWLCGSSLESSSGTSRMAQVMGGMGNISATALLISYSLT